MPKLGKYLCTLINENLLRCCVKTLARSICLESGTPLTMSAHICYELKWSILFNKIYISKRECNKVNK